MKEDVKEIRARKLGLYIYIDNFAFKRVGFGFEFEVGITKTRT